MTQRPVSTALPSQPASCGRIPTPRRCSQCRRGRGAPTRSMHADGTRMHAGGSVDGLQASHPEGRETVG
eukprot:1561421-Pleurochrysis_carterae.AAC.1